MYRQNSAAVASVSAEQWQVYRQNSAAAASVLVETLISGSGTSIAGDETKSVSKSYLQSILNPNYN